MARFEHSDPPAPPPRRKRSRRLLGGYAGLLDSPEVRGFVAFGVVGRMAGAMLSLGVILMIYGLTGSYGTAGLVAGLAVLGTATGAPLLGRFADRYGQGRVLAVAVPVHCTGLVALVGCVVLGLPTWVVAVPAVVAGGCYPPIGSFVRTRWAHRLGGTPRLSAAYSFEAVLDELLFVSGPVIVTLLATRLHPTAGLAAALLVTAVGGAGFLRQRATEPPPHRYTDGGPFMLRTPTVLMMSLVAMVTGVAFGALDVAVVAFTSASGVPWAAGPVLALFAAGSAAGGLVYGVIPWRADPLLRVAGMGTLLGLVFLPLAFLSSITWVAAFAFVSGLAISPLIVSCTTVVERRVRRERLTESLTWFSTGILIGVAAGSWVAGTVADAAAERGGFLVVSSAACLAAGVTWLAWLVLRHRAPERPAA